MLPLLVLLARLLALLSLLLGTLLELEAALALGLLLTLGLLARLLTLLTHLLAPLLAHLLAPLLAHLLAPLLAHLLGLLLKLLGLLLLTLLTHLLTLLASLALLCRLELPRRTPRRHLVWMLWLPGGRLELAGDLLGRHAGCALGAGLRRLLLWQADLLVDLAFLLLALLLVLGRLLDELAGLWVARLEFGLDGLVLAERFGVARVGASLVGPPALIAREPALLLTCLLPVLLLRLLSSLTWLLISLVTHGSVSFARGCLSALDRVECLVRLDRTESPHATRSRCRSVCSPVVGTNVADPVRRVDRT